MTRWLGGAAVAATIVVGCEQSPAAVQDVSDLAPAALVVPTGDRFTVIVCKQGPQGTSTFSVTANTADVTLMTGPTFNLGHDVPCRTVAVTTTRKQSVTVEEIAPAPGSAFVAADVYRYLAGQNTQTLHRVSTSPSVTVTPFGADLGWVIVFRNRDG
jgi:hypothetical protein